MKDTHLCSFWWWINVKTFLLCSFFGGIDFRRLAVIKRRAGENAQCGGNNCVPNNLL